MGCPVHFHEMDSSKKCAKICHNLKYLYCVHKLRYFNISGVSHFGVRTLVSKECTVQYNSRTTENTADVEHAKSDVLASHSMHIMGFTYMDNACNNWWDTLSNGDACLSSALCRLSVPRSVECQLHYIWHQSCGQTDRQTHGLIMRVA